jgi:hypothetical protein
LRFFAAPRRQGNRHDHRYRDDRREEQNGKNDQLGGANTKQGGCSSCGRFIENQVDSPV